VFPDPKLEENERGQLYGYRLRQEETLYTYGWADEKAGTVRIPIESAMELLVQRGLPVRPQGAGSGAATASTAMNTKAEEKQ
jgi:FAD/FMN-containing dehydrogenase